MNLNTLLIFLVTLLVTILNNNSLSNGAELCPKYSPEEIWYSDFMPHLEVNLDEFRVFYGIVFQRLDGDNLFAFLPYLKEDPEQAGNLTRKFDVAREKMLALVERAYDVIEKSWLDVAEVGRQFAEGKVKARHVLQKMEALQNDHNRVARVTLYSAASELASFIKYAIPLVIEDVTRILEEEIAEPPEKAEDVARMIHDKIGEISPENLLGKAVRRFIGRGLGTVFSRTRADSEIILNQVRPRINKLVDDFKKMAEKKPLTIEMWNTFWEKAFFDSLAETQKREAEGKEDLQRVYANEMYLTEVLIDTTAIY